MKILFTILFLFGVAQAQTVISCDSGRVDTVKAFFDMKVPVNRWDYCYNGEIKLTRGTLDSSLMPEGGYIRRRTKHKNGITGYVRLLVIDNRCKTSLLGVLDADKKPLPGDVKYWEIK